MGVVRDDISELYTCGLEGITGVSEHSHIKSHPKLGRFGELRHDSSYSLISMCLAARLYIFKL